jgi:hypothetical protein
MDVVERTEPKDAAWSAHPRWRRSRLAWTSVGVGVLLLGLMFRQAVERDVTWFAPLNFDQSTYLWSTYEAHDVLVTQGLLAAAKQAAKAPQTTGMLLPWAGTALFTFLGPNRLAALTLNFLFFAAFQVALVATLRWASGRWGAAFFGVGLLLTALTPYMWAGGLNDFRLDFIAFCLYGIVLCAVVRSRFFEARRWSLAVGAAAGVLTLLRYIASVYLGGLLVLCFVFFLARLILGLRNPDTRRAACRQLTGVTLAGIVLGSMVLPFFWRDRHGLWNYYVANHVIGPEKDVRAAEQGVKTSWEFVAFYARSVAVDHAGTTFLGLAGLGLVVGLALRLVARRRGAAEGPRPYHGPSAWFALAVAVAVPYVVLTLDVAKSPVVGNVMVPPLLLLALLPVIHLAGVRRGAGAWYAVRAVSALAVVGLLCGAVVQVQGNTRSGFWAQNRGEADKVLQMQDELIHRVAAMQMQTAHVTFDTIQDFACQLPIMIRAREIHGRRITLHQELPINIMAVDEKTAMTALERSDIAVLTDNCPAHLTFLPFYQSMEQLRPKMRAYCECEMVKLKSYHIQDKRYDVYARPQLSFEGNSGTWITSKGLKVIGETNLLRYYRDVELRGPIHLDWLGGRAPSVQVKLADTVLASSLDVKEAEYVIRFTLPDQLPEGDRVELQLKFDRHFVPLEIGMNADTRELVLEMPSRVMVRRRGRPGHVLRRGGDCQDERAAP